MSKIENYVDKVLYNIVADESMKKRIRSDLILQLNEVAQTESIENILERMGDPKDVAKEFMDTIYENKSEIIESLIKEHTKVATLMNEYYEYKSKTKLFGIPLVHIKINRRGGKPCVAKGIISIGTISIGVLSIGAIPLGFICIGGAAAGIISFGGLAIGLLLAMGGFSFGTMAVGGFAVGLGAVGGFAVGKIAIGGFARETVAIGDNAAGKFVMTVQHLGPETKEAVYNLIKTAYPSLPDWIANLFSSIETFLRSS